MLGGRPDLVTLRNLDRLTGDPQVTRLKPFLTAAWWLVLTGWIAALIAPGAAAMSAFTALPALGVEVPSHAAFFADDPDGAGRFAAGFVTYPIFLATDRIQLVLAGIAMLLVLVERGVPCGDGGRGHRLLCRLALLSASGCLAWYLLFVAPPLATSLHDWRTAVLADDASSAATAYRIFDPLHRTAERLTTATLGSLLILVAACGFRTGTNPRKETG